MLRQALAGYQSLPSSDTQAGAQILPVRRELALSRTGRRQEAVVMMAEVMARKDDSDPAEKAIWLQDQTEVLKVAGRLPEAVAVLQNAIKLLPSDDLFVEQRVYLLSMMAELSRRRGDYEEALAASSERIRICEEQFGGEHSKLLNALISHATLACMLPGCPGGEEAALRAVGMAQSAGHESRLADAWISLSETLRIKRQFRESEKALRDAIADVSQTKAEGWRMMELHRRLGDLLTARSDFAAALGEY